MNNVFFLAFLLLLFQHEYSVKRYLLCILMSSKRKIWIINTSSNVPYNLLKLHKYHPKLYLDKKYEGKAISLLLLDRNFFADEEKLENFCFEDHRWHPWRHHKTHSEGPQLKNIKSSCIQETHRQIIINCIFNEILSLKLFHWLFP
jgi:hypothetical protein